MPSLTPRRSIPAFIAAFAVVVASLFAVSPASAVPSPAPAVPTNLTPAGSPWETAPYFPGTWQGDGQAGASYVIRYSTKSNVNGNGGLSYQQTEVSTGGTSDPFGMSEGTYYWQVKEVLGSKSSDWTAPLSFSIDITAPVVTITAPVADTVFAAGDRVKVKADIADTDPNTGANHPVTSVLSVDGTPAQTIAADTTGSVKFTVDTTGFADGQHTASIKATDAAGNSRPAQSVTFVVAPSVPTQLTPATGSFTRDPNVTVTWQATAAGDKYDFEAAADPTLDTTTGAFLHVGVTQYDSSLTSYTAGNAADSTYYWHVRAVAPDGTLGAWSPLWSLTIDTVAPVVTITTPARLDELSHSATFSGTVSDDRSGFGPGANVLVTISKYRVVGNQCTTPIVSFSAPITGTSWGTGYDVSTIEQGTYCVSAVATDQAGNEGTATGTALVKPVAVKDIDGPTLTITSPALKQTVGGASISVSGTATDVDGIAFHRVRLTLSDYDHGLCDSVEKVFSASVQSDGSWATTFDAVPFDAGKYCITVAAVDALLIGPNTSSLTVSPFTIADVTPPAQVTLVSPADGSFVATHDFDLDWKKTESKATYSIESSLDGLTDPTTGDYLHPIQAVVTTTDTFYPLTGVPDAVYYWHVSATDRAGNVGDWSASWKVTVDTTAPDAAGLVSPAYGGFVNTSAVPLTWSSPETGATFTVQWSTSNHTDGTGKLDQSVTAIPVTGVKTYSPTVPDGTYYWQVLVTDVAGNTSVWSTVWLVRVDTVAPNRVDLNLPKNGESVGTGAVHLRWHRVEPSAKYTIQWSTSKKTLPDGSFTTVIASKNTHRHNDTISPALPDGTYFWHVVATDQAGNVGDWSKTRSFTVDTIAPLAPTQVSPLNGAVDTAGTPDLTWTGPEAGVAYQYEYGTDSSFVGATTAGTTSLDVQLSGLANGTYYWHVRAIDQAGNIGAWSDAWVVVVNIPSGAGSTPASDAFGSGVKSSFTAPSPTPTVTEQLGTHALNSPDTTQGNNNASPSNTSSTAGFPWWGWGIAGLALLLVLGLAFFLFRRRGVA